MKKLLTLLLATMLLVTIALPSVIGEEVPTITIMMPGDNSPAENNEVLDELGKRLGINVKVIYVSGGDYESKLNTAIASNTLPDIYRVMTTTTLLELRDAGRLYNFEELLPEYGPDILAAVGDDLYAPIVNEGGVYGLVSKGGSYIKNLAIRKDWLENVGLQMPTDLDSFYEVLKAFTNNDPDGNGANDTYGLALAIEEDGNWQHVMSAFGIPYRQKNGSVLLEDGTVTTYIKHPRFVEAMTYWNKLYKEGLMDPDFATLTRMQSFERLWQGKTGIYGFQAIGTTNNWYPARYTFDVPENPGDLFGFTHLNGVGAVKVYPNYQQASAVINADCAHPELALKLINYMEYNAEGQELVYMGIEGTHFEWIDKENGQFQRLGIYTDDVAHRAAGAYVYSINGGHTLKNAETRLMNQTTQKAQEEEWKVALDYPYIATPLQTRSEYGATLDGITTECFAQLIVTDGDMESELQEFITRWEEEGGLEYEKEATQAYAQEQAAKAN